MTEKYRKRAIGDVDATQFIGGEESAAAVIAWAATISTAIDVHRYMFSGSWNDQHPELWLQVEAWGWKEFISPGHWLILDVAHADAEVLTDDQFREDYEIAEATA